MACILIIIENVFPVNKVLMLFVDPKLFCVRMCVFGGGRGQTLKR